MKKKMLLVFICVVALFALVACGQEEQKSVDNDNQTVTDSNKETESTEPTTETKELEKVVVSEPVRGLLWGPVHIAKELGFFEEQGLDVEIVTVKSDVPTAPVLSGDAQFGLFGPEMILGLSEKGQGVKLLITSTDKYPYSFVLGPNYDSFESLKGTTVGGADSGSSPRQFVRTVLKNEGFNPDSDVNYINLPNASILSGLESGEISASYVSPEARQLALNAGSKVFVDMYDQETHKKILGSESYEMYITFATDEYIKNNPETVQKYVNAIYKAILWTNEHSAQEMADAIRPSFADNNYLDEAIKEIKDNGMYSETGDFSESGFKAINNMAKASGIIKEDVTMDQAVDTSFLKEAQKNITLK